MADSLFEVVDSPDEVCWIDQVSEFYEQKMGIKPGNIWEFDSIRVRDHVVPGGVILFKNRPKKDRFRVGVNNMTRCFSAGVSYTERKKVFRVVLMGVDGKVKVYTRDSLKAGNALEGVWAQVHFRLM